MLAFIPLITVIIAPVSAKRKFLIAAAGLVIAGVLAAGAAIFLSVTNDNSSLALLPNQIFEQLTDFKASPHYHIREVGWRGTLEAAEGLPACLGHGLGTRHYIDIELRWGGQILVEATYAQFISYVGYLGLGALLLLNCRAVIVGMNAVRKNLSPYQRTMILAITVYATITILSGVLHNNLFSPLYSILYGVVLGLSSIIKHLRLPMPSSRERPALSMEMNLPHENRN